MDAREKLRICLLKLLNLSDLKIFGILAFKFDIEIIPGEAPGTAFVAINDKKQLVMRFYESFVNKISSEELLYVMLHEIIHVMSNHVYRGSKVQYHGLFNIACDHIINDVLDNDAEGYLKDKIKSPKERIVINHFKNKNITAEEIYSYLVENAEFETTNINFGDNSEQNDVADLEIQTIEVKMPDGQIINHVVDVKLNKELESVANELSNNLAAEARAIMSSSNFRGTKTSKIQSYINELVKVSIPWEKLLEDAIKTNVTLSMDNKSWKSVNKRMRANGLVLPGFDLDEMADNLYIVIDSSGSITDKDLGTFADVVKQSMIHFNNLFILKHDTEVYGGITKLTKEETFDLKSDVFNIKRRGGTCHKEVFDVIESEYQENDNIAMIIFLTDFCSNITEIWNKYDFTKNVPVKILLPEVGSVSPDSIPSYIDKNPIIIKEII